MNPRQLQQMAQQMQRQMAELRVEGSSGGGMVTVQMSGTKEVLSVKIEKDAVDPDDVDMLQDLVLAAVNEAGRKVDEALQSQVSGMTGGMKIPGF